MEFHELVDIFPIMTGDEYNALRDDIAENGLIEPIWIYEEKIIDGRNRYISCIELGIEPDFRKYTGDDPKSFVISMNLQRRHLTKEQQREIMRQLRAEGKTYQEIADTVKVDTATAWRNTKDVELLHLQKLKGKDNKYRPTTYKPREESWAGIYSSESIEWWTPQKYIDAVRSVMGEIDLDPASNPEADKTVRAERYFTAEDDGLSYEWRGRVFLNPPYGKLGPLFISKLLDEYNVGRVTEFIALVNSNSTDTNWFAPLFKGLICFTNHRINFNGPDSNNNNSTHGSCFIYFGNNKEKFINIFKEFGHVVKKA